MSSPDPKPPVSDRPPASKLRIALIVTGIFVGVTAIWMIFMFGILKLFAAGYVVLAWLIIGGVAWLVLKRKKS